MSIIVPKLYLLDKLVGLELKRTEKDAYKHHFSAVETLLELEQSDLAALGEERLNRKDIDSYVPVSPFLSCPVQSVNCFAELLVVVS